jgi:photosystem II stability/assembly factor-like uncharacterized protein
LKTLILKTMKLLHIIITTILLLPLATQAQSRRSAPAAPPVDTIAPGTIAGLAFRSIGPAFTSGRISDFAVNPADHSEYYVAVSSGHLWKTVNAGTTWQPVFDNYGIYSTGCVTMDPNNSNVIWLGTGENNHQRAVGYGNGVWKSLDGGKSWNNMGLKESRQIGGIIVDPRNSDVVFVAAEGSPFGPGEERGLYKTTDGGKAWKKVITISENTGVNNVVFDPADPNIIYATSEQRRRHAFTKIGGGPESAVYKSTDNGETWKKLTSGLPGGHVGGMGIAVSPANRNIVYLIIEAEGTTGGFFRSADRGESWAKMSDYSSSGQYYNEIVCDPVDPNRVYSLETVTQYTEDGGRTWKALGLSKRHVDDHAMWINPKDPRHMIIGGDGGIYDSWDRGDNWLFRSNLPVTQFYRVGLDNSYPFYNVYGGTQDNNTLGGPSRNNNSAGVSNEDWYALLGGDGFWVAPDPLDPNIVYCEYQYGNMYRHDKKTKENLSIKPQPRKGEDTYKWNWDTPLMISPHSNTRLYTAANKVFRSDDRGESWKVISEDITSGTDRNSWPVMGHYWSIDAVAKDVSTSLWGTAVAFDESPVKEDMLIVGTDDGVISVTEDAGKNWFQVKKFPGVPDFSYVSDVMASKHDANIIFATLRNLKRDDFTPYILKSSDKGRTWVSIAANLPKNGSVHTIEQDHVNADLLFAGTEFGVFVTFDGGRQWTKMSGVPDVAIYDMAIQKRENDLVLATFGRGFYVLDDYTPLRTIAEKKDLLKSGTTLFPVRKALMYLETGEKYGQGALLYHAPNPPFGATFTYYMKETPKSLRQMRKDAEKELFTAGKPIPAPTPDELRKEEEEDPHYLLFTIKDQSGNVVRKITSSPQAGINRITWDLKYESPEGVTFRGNKFNPSASSPSGMPAMPGNYSVTLDLVSAGTVKNLSQPVTFTASTIDNTAIPILDRAELDRFVNEFGLFLRQMTGTKNALDEALTSVIAIRQSLFASVKATPEIMQRASQLEKQLRDLLFIFNGTPARASWEEVPPAQMPLMNRYYAIAEGIWGSTHGVTKAMKEGYAIMKEEFPPVHAGVRKATSELQSIRAEMDRLGVAWTPGRSPGN